MKTDIKFLILGLLILQGVTNSCRKDESEPEIFAEMQFSVSSSEYLNSEFKCTPIYSLNKARSIILTIQTSTGGSTKYTSTSIDIYKMGDAFLSEKLLLVPGAYQLTEFLVADSAGNIIFAVPMTGSELAPAVTDPLPIDFTIETDKSTRLSIEVISTENLNLMKMGLAWFLMNETDLIYLEGGIIDEVTGNMLSAEINVHAEDSSQYSGTFGVVPSTKNMLILPESFPGFYFSIASEGYDTKSFYITTDSLKSIASGSAPIILGLVKSYVVIDIEGNVYRTVKIGEQTWMGENLRTTHLNDNTSLHHSAVFTYWSNWAEWDPSPLARPAYCWLNGEGNEYGATYNYYVVETGKVCPTGWHVPSTEEWDILVEYLGGNAIAGDKLKNKDDKNWYNENSQATDEVGFTALATGMIVGFGDVYSNWVAAWWSSTQAVNYQIWKDKSSISKSTDERHSGKSIRCIQDE